MLGSPTFTSLLATERRARFTAEATAARQRRLLRQRHAAPPCGGLAAQLPDVVLDLRPAVADQAEPAATR